LAAISILLLGVSAGRAEPFSIIQTNEDRAPAMTAWDGNSSGDNHKPRMAYSSLPVRSWRTILGFKENVNLWNPSKKSLFNEESSADFVSSSSSRRISVPAAISDAALELESIPTDDPILSGLQPWDQAPDDTGTSTQYSGNATALETAPPAATTAGRQNGDSIDFSVPDPGKGPSKVDFPLADSERSHSDNPRDPGLSGMEDDLGLPPTGPVTAILSPEPSVTALWSLSAFLFAWRRKVRSRSQS
jgi:hypothetical protein